MQIQIRQLEAEMDMPKRYTISGYDKLHWYALQQLDNELRDYHEEYQKPKSFSRKKIDAAQTIVNYLRDKTGDKDEIPETIPAPKALIKSIEKGIKNVQSTKKKKCTKRPHPYNIA